MEIAEDEKQNNFQRYESFSLGAIQKVHHLGRWGSGFMKKRQQGGGAVKKVISLTQNLSVSIFSANQFLLHFIPRGCVNICNKKKHPRCYLWVWGSYITRSIQSIVILQFFQHGLLINLYLCVNVCQHNGQKKTFLILLI